MVSQLYKKHGLHATAPINPKTNEKHNKISDVFVLIVLSLL